MLDNESTPGMEPTDFGPLNEREISSVLMESTEGKETWYAKMLDRYHEIYQLELSLKKEGADNIEVKPINDDRDRLHKQLERLGKTLGKTKDQVLADVMAREGNLGEYLLPEYGLMTQEQIETGDRSFGGFEFDNLISSDFVRTDSSEEVLNQDRFYLDQKKKGEVFEYGDDWDSETLRVKIPGFGEYEAVEGLIQGQVAVVFGVKFTLDIFHESITIEPPGFPEKFRRAASAVVALRAAGVDAKLLVRTVGTYHDTVTVIGMAVPADHLQDEVVGLLRNHREIYGVRTEDMDSKRIHEEYLQHKQSLQSQIPFIRNTRGCGSLFKGRKVDNASFDRFMEILRRVESEQMEKGLEMSIQQVSEALVEAFPDWRSEEIQTAMTNFQEYLKTNAEWMQKKFDETHEKYFAKKI